MYEVVFFCKHNWFRSRVAEALFNYHAADARIIPRATSAALAQSTVYPHIPYSTITAQGILSKRRVPFNLERRQNIISPDSQIITEARYIIAVADDISLEAFPREKLQVWEIPDVKKKEHRLVLNAILSIEDRVIDFVDSLSK